MIGETDNLVLEHLRYIREHLDRVVDGVSDLKIRMANVEEGLGRPAKVSTGQPIRARVLL